MTFTRQDIKGSWFIMRRVWKKTWKNSRQYPKCLRFPSKVLNTLQCTGGIPDSPDDIRFSNEHPPQYWWHPLQSTDDPSQKYWKSFALLNCIYPQHWRYPSTVLTILHNTNRIASQHWWYPSTVLNILHTTNGIASQHWWYSFTILNITVVRQYGRPSNVMMISQQHLWNPLKSTEHPQ